MKLSTLERLAMNNPVRAFIQRHYEMPLLARLGGSLRNKTLLEVGCGGGIGTEHILEQWHARHVTAIDLDDRMLARARRRLSAYGPDRLLLGAGDATRLPYADASFEAVVCLAAIHHVPDWQAALGEIARVLQPDGTFVFMEVTAQWISRWPNRVLFEHPRDNRFTAEQFIEGLRTQGIDAAGTWVGRGGGDYLFGAGRRAMASRRVDGTSGSARCSARDTGLPATPASV